MLHGTSLETLIYLCVRHTILTLDKHWLGGFSIMNNYLFKYNDDDQKIFPFSYLLELSNQLRDLGGSYYFRGHSCIDWELKPSIARQYYWAGKPYRLPDDDILEQEINLLHRFRRHTYEERGRILNEWEALFLARHHDLPVRLLDWTTNPLVALYNACSFKKTEDNTQNGVIWWFKKRDCAVDINVFKEQEPLNIKGIRLIYPFYPTLKMTAQSGLFTIHEYPWKDL